MASLNCLKLEKGWELTVWVRQGSPLGPLTRFMTDSAGPDGNAAMVRNKFDVQLVANRYT